MHHLNKSTVYRSGHFYNDDHADCEKYFAINNLIFSCGKGKLFPLLCLHHERMLISIYKGLLLLCVLNNNNKRRRKKEEEKRGGGEEDKIHKQTKQKQKN